MRAFADLLLRRDLAGRVTWRDAVGSGLGGFGADLRQDEGAVRTAIAEPWGNDPVVGRVNRRAPIPCRPARSRRVRLAAPAIPSVRF